MMKTLCTWTQHPTQRHPSDALELKGLGIRVSRLCKDAGPALLHSAHAMLVGGAFPMMLEGHASVAQLIRG